MSTPNGPIISDTRPRAIMRMVAIWPSRKWACTRPSAKAASPSLSASMKGICRSLQWIVTGPSSGRPRVGNASRRSATSFCFGKGASSAQLETTRAAAPMASPMEREERKAAMRFSMRRRVPAYGLRRVVEKGQGGATGREGARHPRPGTVLRGRAPRGGSCRTAPLAPSAPVRAGALSRRACAATAPTPTHPPAPCAGRVSARRPHRRAP